MTAALDATIWGAELALRKIEYAIGRGKIDNTYYEGNVFASELYGSFRKKWSLFIKPI